jgi:peptidoglycan/LPS O-acetylase OafA/YrhL
MTPPSITLDSPYQLPRQIPQLDRLRGLAILLVLVCHAGYIAPPALARITDQGWIGVDLFFVLSGFLITGILWDTRDGKRYFRRFYERRVLRIWPVYMLVLVFAFGVMPLLKLIVGGMLLSIPREPLGFWPYLLMVQNLFWDGSHGSSMLGMTWSLAIEEQFYLVWPAVIYFAPRRVILPGLSLGILMCPLLRLWAVDRGFSESTIYHLPLTHGDGLLCGAVLAVWLRTAKPKRRTLLLMGIALLLAGCLLYAPLRPLNVTVLNCSPLVITAVASISTGLLLVALVSENMGRFLHRFVFMSRSLAFLGFISYGLYLYHAFIVRLAISNKVAVMLDRWHHLVLTQWLMVASAVGLSILVAWISRVTLERFALSQKGIFG